jgi:uncharacterized protein with PIN domain
MELNKKQEDKKMEQVTIKKEVTFFRERCPFCEKVVEGTSESQVKYNLEIHIRAKHPEEQNAKQ